MTKIEYINAPTFGTGRSCGSFGELLQGVLPNKKKFMVTFPIEIFSEAKFVPRVGLKNIKVFPEHKSKSYKITEIILKDFEIKYGGILQISSQIPEGKGLASSTADLVASARAISEALNLGLSNEKISEFISLIEPSDGLMYSEIVSFYHEEVKLLERISYLTKLCVIGIDEGLFIDTIAYNSVKREYPDDLCTEYYKKLKEITEAIRCNDLVKVGQISTESALLNQVNNHKYFLNDMMGISNSVSALGVIAAHSGTYIGILLNAQDISFQEKKNQVIKFLLKLNKEPKIFYSLSQECTAQLPNNTKFTEAVEEK